MASALIICSPYLQPSSGPSERLRLGMFYGTSLLSLVQIHCSIPPSRVQYGVFVHAPLPLAHLHVRSVGNELPEPMRHNNGEGRDEMDSLLGVFSLRLLSRLPRQRRSRMALRFTRA